MHGLKKIIFIQKLHNNMDREDWNFGVVWSALITIGGTVILPIAIFVYSCRSFIRRNIPNLVADPSKTSVEINQVCDPNNSLLVNIALYASDWIGQHPYIFLTVFLILAIAIAYLHSKL